MANNYGVGVENRWFSKISANKSNYLILRETVAIEKLRGVVFDRLEKIKKEDVLCWWKDKELVGTFDKLYTVGIILLPLDTVDRVRWIALVCIKICELEGFPIENVLPSIEYIPDESLDDFRDIFGSDVIDDTMKSRRGIKTNGWKSLL